MTGTLWRLWKNPGFNRWLLPMPARDVHRLVEKRPPKPGLGMNPNIEGGTAAVLPVCTLTTIFTIH
jgi:hypothetical protein